MSLYWKHFAPSWGMSILKPRRTLILACALSVVSAVCFGDLISVGGKAIEPDSRAAIQKFIERGDLEAAKRKLAEVFGAQANVPHPHLILAQLLFERGNGMAAKQVLEKLAADEPNRFDVRFAFVQLAVNEQRWFEALLHVEAIDAAKMPENWDAAKRNTALIELSQLQGKCFEARGQWIKAEQAYSKTLAGELPEESQLVLRKQALEALARVKFHQEDIKSSYQYLVELRDVAPESFPPEVVLAALFDSDSKSEEAHGWFEKGFQKHPDLVAIPYARWLIVNNKPKLAEPVLKHKVDESLFGEDGEETNQGYEHERQFLLGQAARMRGDFERAQEILSDLHQSQPTAFLVGNALALSLIEDSDETKRARALQIAETNLRQNQSLSEAWSTLGWVQFKLGDVVRAKESLGVAARAGQITRDTAYFLSELHNELNEFERANELRQAAYSASGAFFYSFKK